ncbi:MAG: phenylalanine--tRNA ligase subunit beta [Candidatus Eiseniibacteriota bacterium]
MKIPVSWLAELVPVGEPVELADRLTEAGLESHASAAVPVPPGIVTGRILACERHPDADRLSVCTVDVGEGAPRTVVCGAPNAKAGPVGAVALPGADLGGGLVVAERKVRGVVSRGMLCSERELGLSDNHEGILLLPADTPIGKPLGDVLRGETVLETAPFANRGDLMSVAGVAREVAALQGTRWSPPVPPPARAAAGEWRVEIEDAEDCPRYAGRVVEGVRAGVSPSWIAERLSRAGVRPVMNLVDVTNYVLLETGHPLHAFDRERLRGRTIGVRRARAGESLVTLDGKERAPDPGTLLITDDSGPIATAGILGGASTAVSERTTAVFLEGASFHPQRVRAGSRALRVSTDASARFERGVDPEGVDAALDRAVEILLAMCPGARLVHSVEAGVARPSPRRVTLRNRTIVRLLGVDPGPAVVTRVLESLGFGVTARAEGWDVTVPSFRRDVSIEEDLVEEIARIHGYARIPETSRFRGVAGQTTDVRAEAYWRARAILLSLGLTEVVTPGLVDGEREGALMGADPFFPRPVPVRNPLSADRGSLRCSLSTALAQVLATNRARASADIAVFEVGRVFAPAANGTVDERLRAGMLLAGSGLAAEGALGSKCSDFFDMKGLVEVYVEQFWGVRPRCEGFAPLPFSRARSAAVVGGAPIGYFGAPDDSLRNVFDLPAELPLWIAELDLEAAAVQPGEVWFEALPRYPAVVRDLALVVDRSRRNEDLVAVIVEAGGELLTEPRLFDVYEGAQLAATEKSLAYTLVFRATDRSLTHYEVDHLVERIVRRLERELGARVR